MRHEQRILTNQEQTPRRTSSGSSRVRISARRTRTARLAASARCASLRSRCGCAAQFVKHGAKTCAGAAVVIIMDG